MKENVYVIFAGLIFVVMFFVFGIILHFNMISEAKIDNFSRTDQLLSNVVTLSDKALHNLMHFEIHHDSTHKVISTEELYQIADSFEVSEFLSQNVASVMVVDSFIIVKKETLNLIPRKCVDKNLPLLKTASEEMMLYGFSNSVNMPAEINKVFLEHFQVNTSYGFFETKNYLVNYKSSTKEHNHKFTIIYFKLKSVIFKHINDITTLFLVLLTLGTLLIAVFIAFYINSVSHIIVIEEKRKKEIELLKLNRVITMEKLSESIVHNINNPLTNVKGYLQILLSKKPELLHDFKLDVVMKNLNFVIDQLKTILIKSRGENNLDMVSVNLNSMIITELEFLENFVKSKGIGCTYDLDPHLPEFECNYNDFKMIFLNLIDNAVDSMHGSTIKNLTIKTLYKNRNILLMVEDTGCGIDQDIRDKIFEMYFTTKPSAYSSKDQQPVGTGIGLFSVSKLVEKYYGKIEFSSIVNKGTTFTVSIPIV